MQPALWLKNLNRLTWLIYCILILKFFFFKKTHSNASSWPKKQLDRTVREQEQQRPLDVTDKTNKQKKRWRIRTKKDDEPHE